MVVHQEEDLDVVELIVGRNTCLRQGMSSAVIILNALSVRSFQNMSMRTEEDGMSVLEVREVSKSFDAVRAVCEVSFSAQRGEILGFLGPNGAGKTTTIRMIMGILQPDQGEIRFTLNGQSNQVNKERIGYLPEERGLYDDAKVLDTLIYFAELKGLPRSEAQTQVLEWLERFDLTEWAKRKIEKLSKGMQQKVQFIAAVLHRPDLVVLDEPFSGLDPVNQDLFKEVIRELKEDGMTILLSSHQMNRVEELCDRIFLIHHGKRVLYGDLSEIKEAYGEHVVRLRYAGNAGFLSIDPRIKDLRMSGDRATFTLHKEVEPDAFVRNIPPDLVIREIAVERPPLHDIFVHTVAGGNHETQ